MVVTGAPRKRLVGKPARGFESHPLRQIPHSLHLVERVGFRRSAAEAASGSNPCCLPPQEPPHSLHLVERVGFRRSAAEAASGSNPCCLPPQEPPHSLHLVERVGFRRSAAAPLRARIPAVFPGPISTFAPIGVGWASGAPRLRRFGLESLLSFRAQSPHSLQLGSGGLQALRRRRRLRARIPAVFLGPVDVQPLVLPEPHLAGLRKAGTRPRGSCPASDRGPLAASTTGRGSVARGRPRTLPAGRARQAANRDGSGSTAATPARVLPASEMQSARF